jgi:hypothetical protein
MMRPEFALAYRFMDSSYAQLPEEALNKIQDLEAKDAKKIWQAWVSVVHDHLCQMTDMAEFVGEGILMASFCLDSEEVKNSRDIFRSQINVADNRKVFVSWSPQNAVETTWGVFVEYWDDFFYPSDDNNVVVFPLDGLLLTFVEERCRLVKRRVT